MLVTTDQGQTCTVTKSGDLEIVAECSGCPEVNGKKREWIFTDCELGEAMELAEAFAKRHESLLRGHSVRVLVRQLYVGNLFDGHSSYVYLPVHPPESAVDKALSQPQVLTDIRALAEMTMQNCGQAETVTLAQNVIALLDAEQ